MTRKLYSFDIETRCGLGVAMHAAMCADATLAIDTVVVIDTVAGEPCKYLGMDIGIRDTIVEVRDMFKTPEDRVLIRAEIDEPPRIRPAREPKKRDWEQRNKKQRRR